MSNYRNYPAPKRQFRYCHTDLLSYIRVEVHHATSTVVFVRCEANVEIGINNATVVVNCVKAKPCDSKLSSNVYCGINFQLMS
jgi:hypothetical protein